MEVRMSFTMALPVLFSFGSRLSKGIFRYSFRPQEINRIIPRKDKTNMLLTETSFNLPIIVGFLITTQTGQKANMEKNMYRIKPMITKIISSTFIDKRVYFFNHVLNFSSLKYLMNFSPIIICEIARKLYWFLIIIFSQFRRFQIIRSVRCKSALVFFSKLYGEFNKSNVVRENFSSSFLKYG